MQELLEETDRRLAAQVIQAGEELEREREREAEAPQPAEPEEELDEHNRRPNGQNPRFDAVRSRRLDEPPTPWGPGVDYAPRYMDDLESSDWVASQDWWGRW